MIVPPSSIPADTLDRILADFATRDGTFIGDGPEPSLEEKVAALRVRLARGDLLLTFDAESESLSMVTKDELHRG